MTSANLTIVRPANLNNLFIGCAAMCCTVLSVSAGLYASEFAVLQIPTLGGERSGGWSVNNQGQVAGFALDASGSPQPILWEAGVLTNLNDGSFVGGTANRINNHGEVVGFFQATGTVADRGFHWDAGNLTILQPPSGSSGHFTLAEGINDHGAIIGSAAVAGPNGFQAFIWNAGDPAPAISLPQITDTGNGFFAGHQINNNGQATGYYDSNLEPWLPWRGFTFVDGESITFVDGESIDVGTLGDEASFVEAWGINDAGKIVGYSDTNFFFDTRAFLRDESGMINLGTLDGGDFSSAYEINNHDWVVGDARNDDDQLRAFLWRNGNMIDLNDLIDPNSGWVLERGRSVSDTGWIVGLGRLKGEERGFVIFVPTGDINGDGVIDINDLFLLLAAWGECEDPTPGNCPADLNGDGEVDTDDLFMLLERWN